MHKYKGHSCILSLYLSLGEGFSVVLLLVLVLTSIVVDAAGATSGIPRCLLLELVSLEISSDFSLGKTIL